jgi:hypothetical protein
MNAYLCLYAVVEKGFIVAGVEVVLALQDVVAAVGHETIESGHTIESSGHDDESGNDEGGVGIGVNLEGCKECHDGCEF